MEHEKNEILITAAIDFGTTYSGLAYSYSAEKNVVHVQSRWPDGSVYEKVPTVVLFNREKKFVAFGEEAMEKYCDLCDDGVQQEFYFFKHFKMALYDSKYIRKDMLLTEENGKQMDAMHVFSEVIRYMKDHLISSICKRGEIVCLDIDCTRWVKTVPAIWSHSAKVFMRKAAEKAGLPPQELVIALEPECASIYCNTAPKERMCMTADYNKPGTKFLVLDNGGGTIDITAHQILEDGNIKEIFKANGGPWGGKKVDEMFEKFLEKLFSHHRIQKLKNNYKLEWVKLLEEFHTQKNKIKWIENEESTIALTSVPWDLQYFERLPENVKEGVEIKGSRLRISKGIIHKMIRDVSKHIISHVTTLLAEESLEVDVIMMVGGFSNSPVLVEEMKGCVSHGIPVVVPEDAQLSVLKGAVLFGWNQDKITSRRSKYTYLYATTTPFKENVHPEWLSFYVIDIDNEEKRCDTLKTLITVNDELDLDHMIKEDFYSLYKTQEEISFKLYASSKETAMYPDDEDVEEIGSLTIPLTGVTSVEDKEIDVEFYFGKTELKVLARDQKTGETYEGFFDLIG